jgi:hypothetical protein
MKILILVNFAKNHLVEQMNLQYIIKKNIQGSLDKIKAKNNLSHKKIKNIEPCGVNN